MSISRMLSGGKIAYFLLLLILEIKGVHAGCEDDVFNDPAYYTCMLTVYSYSTNQAIFFPHYLCGLGRPAAECALDALTPCPTALYALPDGYETPEILGSTLTEIVVNWTSVVPYCNGTICSENWEQEKLVFDCVKSLESTGLDNEDNAFYFCGTGKVHFMCAVTGFSGCNPLLDMHISYVLDVFHPNVSRESLLADDGVEGNCLVFMTSASTAMSTPTAMSTSPAMPTSTSMPMPTVMSMSASMPTSTSMPMSTSMSVPASMPKIQVSTNTLLSKRTDYVNSSTIITGTTHALLNSTITPVNPETKNLAQCFKIQICLYLSCMSLIMMLIWTTVL